MYLFMKSINGLISSYQWHNWYNQDFNLKFSSNQRLVSKRGRRFCQMLSFWLTRVHILQTLFLQWSYLFLVLCAKGAYSDLRSKIRMINLSGMVIFKNYQSTLWVFLFCFEDFPILQTNPISGLFYMFGTIVVIIYQIYLYLSLVLPCLNWALLHLDFSLQVF